MFAFVVNAPSLNSFKNRLDRFWFNQDILYNWHARGIPEYKGVKKLGERQIIHRWNRNDV